MEAALASRRKQLKKVQRRETEKVTTERLCKSDKDYFKMMGDTYLEQYFQSIQASTFGSVFLPLNKPTAQSLLKEHAEFLKAPSKFTLRDPLVTSLAQAIDRTMQEKKWPGIFVRLSTRSPKDAALSSEAFATALAQELATVQGEHRGKEGASDLNSRAVALYRTSTWALRSDQACTSGAAAVSLIARSPRVADDIRDFLKGALPSPFNVIVREFRTFDPAMEFRGFVKGPSLTALTQYNQFCFFPSIASRATSISDLIIRSFDPLRQRIPLTDFVVDFVLAPARETQERKEWGALDRLKLYIVEVNPLAEFAGTGLFSWERDRETLLGGRPFEFRVHTRPPSPPWVLGSVGSEWRAFLSGKTKEAAGEEREGREE